MSTLDNMITRSVQILYNLNSDDNEIGMDNEQLYNDIQSDKNNMSSHTSHPAITAHMTIIIVSTRLCLTFVC